MPVGTAVAGQPGEHQPQAVEQFCSGAEGAEGSRRYLEALSTYTRRRMTQAAKAQVEEALYIPAALALHQRPGIPPVPEPPGLQCAQFLCHCKPDRRPGC